jgi:hypothetical protein
MIVNSIGDWVIYAFGLGVVLNLLSKGLPDMVVVIALQVYRAWRKLLVGIAQIRAEMPLESNKPKELNHGTPKPDALAALDRVEAGWSNKAEGVSATA